MNVFILCYLYISLCFVSLVRQRKVGIHSNLPFAQDELTALHVQKAEQVSQLEIENNQLRQALLDAQSQIARRGLAPVVSQNPANGANPVGGSSIPLGDKIHSSAATNEVREDLEKQDQIP